MTIVDWVLCIAALLTNGLAIRALFARDRFKTWKRRCFIAAALLFCAVTITSVVSVVRAPAAAPAPKPVDALGALEARVAELEGWQRSTRS